MRSLRDFTGSTPKYRFHGSTPPDPKRPRAALVANEPVDGVATLRIYDVIDSWGGIWGISAAEVADALDSFGADVTEIRLRINSPGGEIFEGVAIMNLLRQHDARVVAYVDGLAASAASFLACSADETLMGDSTQMMIHDGWGLCIGNAADMHGTGDLLDRLSTSIAEVYAKKSGGDVAGWRSAMLAETWYSAVEAVEAGLADKVIGADDEGQDDDAQNSFDLRDLGFKHAGRAEAPAPTVPAAAAAAVMTEQARQKRERLLDQQIKAG